MKIYYMQCQLHYHNKPVDNKKNVRDNVFHVNIFRVKPNLIGSAKN